MKKSRKKIVLAKETIGNLNAIEAAGVAGGISGPLLPAFLRQREKRAPQTSNSTN